MNLNNKIILIGLSGGINSAALLCWLIANKIKPRQLHLYYAHFAEHAPDTFQFVADLIRYARKKLRCPIVVKITRNSVLRFFSEQKMIPHPTVSPCSRKLKIEPINKYAFDNGIEVDLIGYVKEEYKRRAGKQFNPQLSLFDATKFYPIGDQQNEWCFEIVKQHIGWYPAIYDIRDADSNRVFKHNNCLPCKKICTRKILKRCKSIIQNTI